jgi:chromosome segregation ATPase
MVDPTTSSSTDLSQVLAQKNARIDQLKEGVRARDAALGPLQRKFDALRRRMSKVKGENKELGPRLADLQRQLNEVKAENARLKRGGSGDSAASEDLLREARALKAEAQSIVANGLSQEHFLNDLSQQKRDFEGIMRR